MPDRYRKYIAEPDHTHRMPENWAILLIWKYIERSTRKSEWGHLSLLKASEESSQKIGNGYYRNCIPAAGRNCRKLLLLEWTEARGWSPCRNELKIYRSPILAAPDKTQKPWSKWTTSENRPQKPSSYKNAVPSGTAQKLKKYAGKRAGSTHKSSRWDDQLLKAENTEKCCQNPT
jgi:hypothetical protein